MTAPVPRRALRPAVLLPALAAAAFLLPARPLGAQTSVNLQHPFALGATRALRKPYSFTGRVFDNNNISFGSGTLIRRHTVLTAGHVIFEQATGFGTSLTFERALYNNTRLSSSRSIAVSVLSGYQNFATSDLSTEAESRDLGYLVLASPSVDEDFAPFKHQPEPVSKPNNLTDDSGRFVLGYPGVTFNGRTLAYIVPQAPFVEVAPGYYRNFDYLAEQGMSGGPVYAVINDVQTVVGETTDGLADPTGEFSFSSIRAIDKEAGRFLVAAEYDAGLIAGAIIRPADPAIVVDPKLNQITVNRGDTVSFTATLVFTTKGSNGQTATTDRYKELNLTSAFSDATTGSTAQPLVKIVKVAANQFKVTFNSAIRPNTVVTLQARRFNVADVPAAPVPTGSPASTLSPAPSTLRVLVK